MQGANISVEEIEAAFHHHFEGLHRYAYTIVKNNEAAKDVTQQIFLALWEKRDTIQITQSLKAYLYRAVHNLSINHISRGVKHESLEAANFLLESTPTVKHVEVKELQVKINESLGKLPAQCKAVFLKSREEEKTYAQIAAEMSISQKTVEAHMSKALRTLREELSGLFYFLLITTLLLNHIA